MKLNLNKKAPAEIVSKNRSLRLEQLERRWMLSGNPVSFFTHDHVRVDGVGSLAPQQISVGRNSDFRDQGGRSLAPQYSVRPEFLGRSDAMRGQSRPDVHENRVRGDRDLRNFDRFEFVQTLFTPPPPQLRNTDPATTIQSQTQSGLSVVVVSPFSSLAISIFSPSSGSPKNSSNGPLPSRSQASQTPSNRSAAEESGLSAKQAPASVDAAISSIESSDETASQQTLTSIIARNDRIVSSGGTGMLSQTSVWRPTTPNAFSDVAIGEIGDWLKHAESLQEKFEDLDRTLQELAEDQSRSSDPLNRDSSLSPRRSSHLRKIDDSGTEAAPPTNQWLGESNGLLLAPAAQVPGSRVSQAELNSKLADAANSGWTIGIGVYQSFESTSDPSDTDLMFTSAVRTVKIASSRLKPQEDESSETSRTPTVASTSAATAAVFAVALSRVWYIRERRRPLITRNGLGLIES